MCCIVYHYGMLAYGQLLGLSVFLYGASNCLLQKVQFVRNAATRLITGTRWCERIIPVLQKLHWLSVRRRIEFKLACLVHQSLAGQTPSYLASDIQLT